MGGSPIIMGGSTSSELQAQLERAALDNEKMLQKAADEQIRLQTELDAKDKEMTTLLEQQAQQQQLDLGRAQKALGVEIDALEEQQASDDLEVNFDALQKALAEGFGTSSSNMRPE